MKTFRELKAGDKFYIVNEGQSVGYIRLEEYILLEPLHPSDKVVGTYIAKQKNCSWDLIIHESLIDSSNCGFIFTTLEEACNFYVKKASEIVIKLQNKYNETIKEAKRLWINFNTIAQNIKNTKDGDFDKIIISKQYNEDN